MTELEAKFVTDVQGDLIAIQGKRIESLEAVLEAARAILKHGISLTRENALKRTIQEADNQPEP